MEHIDIMIEQFGIKKVIDYCEMAGFDYLSQSFDKEGESKEQDEQKAMCYLKKEIELVCQMFGHDCTNNEEKQAEKNKKYFLRKISEIKKTMEETITLNQLIKRLYNYRAEHPESGQMKIYAGSLSLTGEVEKKDEFLALK